LRLQHSKYSSLLDRERDFHVRTLKMRSHCQTTPNPITKRPESSFVVTTVLTCSGPIIPAPVIIPARALAARQMRVHPFTYIKAFGGPQDCFPYSCISTLFALAPLPCHAFLSNVLQYHCRDTTHATDGHWRVALSSRSNHLRFAFFGGTMP